MKAILTAWRAAMARAFVPAATGMAATVAAARRADKKPATRAGVLNTGELIVLCPDGRQIIFGIESTDMLRDVLINDSAMALDPAVGGHP